MPEKILDVFTHIPKTAGSTLNRLMSEQYVLRSGLTYAGGGLAYIDHFLNLSSKEKRNLKLVKQHFHFGIHLHVPTPVRYFTLLRQPERRAISQFHHMQRMYKYYPQYKNLRLDTYTLREFLETGVVEEMDNCQVRFLCGTHNIPYGGVTEQHLEQALHNLKTYYIVGITERFTESVLYFASQLGWNDPYYVNAKVSPIKVEDTPIDKDVQALLKHYNRFDHVLYETGISIFNEQLRREGPQLQDKVSDFLRRNESRKKKSILMVHLISKLRYLNKHHLWNLQHTLMEHLRVFWAVKKT